MNIDTEDDEEWSDEDDLPSKSNLKREHLGYQKLALLLRDLPEGTFAEMPLSDRLRDQLLVARRINKGALKRQVRYLGRIIADEGAEEIEATLDAIYKARDNNTRAFKELERWRDQLLSGDQALLTELVDQFAHADVQHLRQLIRNATRESERQKPPKSARLLFRYLSELRDG